MKDSEKDVKCDQCTPDSINMLKTNTDETITWCKCEKCDKWIHAICDNLTKEEVEMTSQYFCKKCREKGLTIMKKVPVKAKNNDEKMNKGPCINDAQKSKITNDQNDNPHENNTSKENLNNEDDEIIPNSQPQTDTTLKKPKGNIFSQKKQAEITEDSEKSEALQHRTKAVILKEYKKLEMKIKERDEKFKEKVETIDQLNKEIEKMKAEQNSLNATIKSQQ